MSKWCLGGMGESKRKQAREKPCMSTAQFNCFRGKISCSHNLLLNYFIIQNLFQLQKSAFCVLMVKLIIKISWSPVLCHHPWKYSHFEGVGMCLAESATCQCSQQILTENTEHRTASLILWLWKRDEQIKSFGDEFWVVLVRERV